MAITLKKTLSFDVSALVTASVQNVKEVKRAQAAKVEADFQRAIAGGEMSYEAQLKFREQQLADEEKSSIKDDDLISSLKKSIDSTKKLSRFEKIRTKYKNSLDDYVTGRGSIDAHIKILEDTLATEQD